MSVGGESNEPEMVYLAIPYILLPFCLDAGPILRPPDLSHRIPMDPRSYFEYSSQFLFDAQPQVREHHPPGLLLYGDRALPFLTQMSDGRVPDDITLGLGLMTDARGRTCSRYGLLDTAHALSMAPLFPADSHLNPGGHRSLSESSLSSWEESSSSSHSEECSSGPLSKPLSQSGCGITELPIAFSSVCGSRTATSELARFLERTSAGQTGQTAQWQPSEMTMIDPAARYVGHCPSNVNLRVLLWRSHLSSLWSLPFDGIAKL